MMLTDAIQGARRRRVEVPIFVITTVRAEDDLDCLQLVFTGQLSP